MQVGVLYKIWAKALRHALGGGDAPLQGLDDLKSLVPGLALLGEIEGTINRLKAGVAIVPDIACTLANLLGKTR